MRLPFVNAACSALSLLALAAAGCRSESDPPIYLDTDYQLRCIDCQPRTADEPERDVALLDGEEGWTVSCSISELSGRPAMTMTAVYQGEQRDETHGIRIKGAHIEGDVTDSCEVRVVEGANTYEGKCTSDEPTEAAPCQVKFRKKDNVVEGGVFCSKIPNTASLTSFRYLVEPGSRDESAPVAVHNCVGL
jgi:hypothetical protein